MNVYVWQRVGAVSSNWHSSGGLLVVAPGLTQARERIAAAELCDDEGRPCEALAVDPDHALPTADDTPEMLLVFPDAGCC
jgi:hypothetical protein